MRLLRKLRMNDLMRAVRVLGLLVGTSCSASAATCENIEKAREAAYFPYVRLVSDEISEARKNDGTAPINTIINRLANKYEQFTRAGDLVSLRKLVAIGLFTAMAARKEPLDVTFKLVCELARKPQPPENVIDPLLCATIAVYGARRDDAANRALALGMIDRARKNLATDRDPAGAKYLFETISPIVAVCAASQ